MKGKKIKAWITRYALTNGIKVVDAEVCENEQMISYGKSKYGLEFASGNDWHRTPAAALARAEEMRKTKIASMRKRIAEIEAMTFNAPNDVECLP